MSAHLEMSVRMEFALKDGSPGVSEARNKIQRNSYLVCLAESAGNGRYGQIMAEPFEPYRENP